MSEYTDGLCVYLGSHIRDIMFPRFGSATKIDRNVGTHIPGYTVFWKVSEDSSKNMFFIVYIIVYTP